MTHREDFGFLSRHVPQTADRIATHIERGAPSEFEAKAEIILGHRRVRRAKTRFDAKHSAELAASRQLALTA